MAVLGLFQTAPETWSLRAVVLDGKNAPVRDLEMTDVSLTENGVTVPVTRFERDERDARVALLIDSSQPFGTAYRLHFLDAAKVAEGRNLFRVFPHNILYPGIFLGITVLAVNMLGDGLRDTLDPKMAGR